MTRAPEPKTAPTPSRSAPPTSRSAPDPIVAPSPTAATPSAESIDSVDPPPAESAPAVARAPGSLSDVVCKSHGYGKSAHAMWLAAHDDLIACGELQTNATSCTLSVSIWHGKPSHGGGPLPGHGAAIGTGGEDLSATALQCLTELAERIETQLSPQQLPARADCRARFQRG